MDRFFIVAHRGGKSSFQENTLNAFMYGLKHGANAVEMDVRFDHLRGRFYLEHDFLHYPWRNLNVIEKTLPALPEKMTLFIELKCLGIFNWRYAKKFAAIADKFNLKERAVIMSFNPWVLLQLRKLRPDLKIGVLVGTHFEKRRFMYWLYDRLKPDYLMLHFRHLKHQIVDFAKERNLNMLVFTANKEAHWHTAKEKGFCGVITDYPSEAWETVG